MKRILPLLMAMMAGPAHAADIQLRADAWCPYNCEPDAAHPGYLIEVAKAVFEPLGHRVNYQLLNWSRTLVAVEAGTYDGAIGAAQSDAPNLVYPAESLGASKNCFFVKQGQPWRYAGIDSLNAVALGVIADYSYGDVFDAYLAQHARDTKRVQTVAGDDALALNVKKLQAGRIGAVLEDDAVMRFFLKSHGQESHVLDAGCDAEKIEIYIAFSPKSAVAATYAKQLSEGIVRLRKDGRLSKILSTYGLQDWK